MGLSGSSLIDLVIYFILRTAYVIMYSISSFSYFYIKSNKSLSNLKCLLKFTFIKIAGENINLQLVKWAKVFGAKTMEELEQLADTEEVFESMVTHLKELSEDEKIRQQCAARDDYERRLIGEYNRGERDGREAGKEIGEKIGKEIGKEIGRLEDIKNIMY